MGHVDSKFVNSDLKPSEVTETPWVYEKNDELEKKFNPGKDFGKWTMYFSIDEIDQKWFEARLAYNAKKLPGISDMKVKTAYKSEDDPANYSTTKVIIFYCGPASDEEKMLIIGRNLVQEIPYTDKFGWIYYKSDRQTFQGSRKTGNKKNHLYKLPVPRKTVEGNHENFPPLIPFNDLGTTSRPALPDISPVPNVSTTVEDKSDSQNSFFDTQVDRQAFVQITRSQSQDSKDSKDSFYDPKVDEILQQAFEQAEKERSQKK
uniref:Uncharacterized protein n=1 Tax=Acrobeloides nanus TaxID=290746 RepID=A0A914D2E3_9BILA